MPALVRRLALALVLPLLVASAARAEGLVQLTFRGQVLPVGGAPVEIELGVWDGAQRRVRELALNVHLAQATSAADLAALLAAQLERSGATALLPRSTAPTEGPVHVFVEGVTHAHLRLGHGLEGKVTLCDAAPRSVRVQPPEIARGAASLTIAATTFHPHSRHIGRKELSLELDELATSAQVSERLARAGIDDGWVADRPTPDRWAASRTQDGAEVSGCSIELTGKAHSDWRLEVQLEVPRED